MPVTIKSEVRAQGRVVWLTLDNQARLNAVGTEMMVALREAALDLAADDTLRAVVITGAGDRAFSGGADIHELNATTADTARAFITSLHETNTAIRDIPVPVIARVNGYCLGGALEIAASCDLRVAADSAKFGMPEVRVGLPSVIEAALLPRLVGWGKAMELVLTGDMITAQTAESLGLVQRVVTTDALDDAVEQWLTSILASGPLAVRTQKALCREWESLPLDQAIRRGIDYFADAYGTDEPARLLAPYLRSKG
jgi:enoyl-CoA hydratase/carnithine racemase